MEEKRENKKGQITIFVIIALILVVTLALVFVLIKTPSTGISADKPDTSKSYITKCARDALSEAESLVIPHGGFLDTSTTNFVRYSGRDVLWLCYTSDYETKCRNKHPMLQQEIERQLENYVKPKIEECFSTMKTQLRNYDYKDEPLYLDIKIIPTKTYMNITKKISYKINEQTINIEKFDSSINSPLYDFVSIANEISNQELRNCNCIDACNADIFELNRLNPAFAIRKPAVGGDGEEVYTITEISSGKEFDLAIRNCVDKIMT